LLLNTLILYFPLILFLYKTELSIGSEQPCLSPTKWKYNFPHYRNEQINKPVLQWLLSVHFETLVALEALKNKDQGLCFYCCTVHLATISSFIPTHANFYTL